jgi:alginate O-acetyltransferase complex protein AlgI
VLFNSYPFVLVFLPAVLAGFALLARWHARKAVLAFLIAASLAFYTWWDWRFLPLLAFSVLFNFSVGAQLARQVRAHGAASRPARRLLALGVAVNLGLLGYFKYRNLIAETVSAALGARWQIPPLVLPLAISKGSQARHRRA